MEVLLYDVLRDNCTIGYSVDSDLVDIESIDIGERPEIQLPCGLYILGVLHACPSSAVSSDSSDSRFRQVSACKRSWFGGVIRQRCELVPATHIKNSAFGR